MAPHTALWSSDNGLWTLTHFRGDSGATYYALYDTQRGDTYYPDRGHRNVLIGMPVPCPKYVTAAAEKHIARYEV